MPPPGQRHCVAAVLVFGAGTRHAVRDFPDRHTPENDTTCETPPNRREIALSASDEGTIPTRR